MGLHIASASQIKMCAKIKEELDFFGMTFLLCIMTGKTWCSMFAISFRIRLVGGTEKWEDRRDLVFCHMCLVGRMKKWKDGKLIYLVEEKSKRMQKCSLYEYTLMHQLHSI